MSEWEKIVVPAKDGVVSYPNGYKLSLPDGAVWVHAKAEIWPGFREIVCYQAARKRLEKELEDNNFLRLTPVKERRFTSTHSGSYELPTPVEVVELSCYAVPENDCPFAEPEEDM